MANEETYARSGITPGRLIAPIVTLAILFVFWRLGQKWVIIPAVAFMLFFYLVLPKLVRTRERAFHREALRLLATGKAAEVPRLARRQLLLQLLGRSAPVDAKLGLAYSQLGEHAAAVSHLQSAVPLAPESERPVLQASLCKALLVTGDPARAEAEGRSLLSLGTRLPETLVIMARARVGQGKVDSGTAELLDEARRLSNAGDISTMITLTEIEGAIATGRRHGEIPDGADSTERFLRVWIHYVRGLVRDRRGDAAGAAQSYAKAVREGATERCWFADMAHDRLGRLSVGAPAQAGSPGDDDMDPALRRKRKARR